MTEHSPFKPRYLVISDELREQVRRGDLKPGARLPSERELCGIWGCSTITARHAVAVLRTEGLIRTVRGSGAFVAPQPAPIRVTSARFSRSLRQRRRVPNPLPASSGQPEVEYLATRTAEATAEVAEELDVSEGDLVTEVTSRVTLSGEAIAAGHVWAPHGVADGPDIESWHDGVFGGADTFERFDAIGIRIDAAMERVHARMPELEETHQYEIPPTVPVVQVWQTLLAGDRPVQVAKIVYRGDRYEFSFTRRID